AAIITVARNAWLIVVLPCRHFRFHSSPEGLNCRTRKSSTRASREIAAQRVATCKITRHVVELFGNGWRFQRTSDRRQIRRRTSPKRAVEQNKFQRSNRAR